MHLFNRKSIVLISTCLVFVCFVVIGYLFYSSSMNNSSISPSFDISEITYVYGETTIGDEKRDLISMYMRYKFNIGNNQNDNLYWIEVLLPEQIAADIGYNQITKDIIDTADKIKFTSLMSIIFPVLHSEFLDSYTFEVI